MKKKIWLSWSTGKDSAYTLYRLQSENRMAVESLLTTITTDYERVSMHSTQKKCLDLQSESLGLPIVKVEIPSKCTNEIYENQFLSALNAAKTEGIDYIAYGDLFLDDIKTYRQNLHKKVEIKPIFPLWGLETKTLARQMIDLGFEAFITCIDSKKLPKSFAGRKYDHSFIDDLPDSVDPCGENGEFHTFVYNGPIFKKTISAEVGEIVERDGFIFADVAAY
ncbi:MAG: diphthine--ammonia ligase [Bdellovibrionales bacterium]|nr:diphthine--ammonia ligase [Bdellovibrionales bacterium]